MARLFFFLLLAAFACNTNADKSGSDDQKAKGSKTKTPYNWTKEDENSFLADCMDGAQENLREDSAFVVCKCMLTVLKEDFPNMDSVSAYMTDSSKIASYTQRCKK